MDEGRERRCEVSVHGSPSRDTSRCEILGDVRTRWGGRAPLRLQLAGTPGAIRWPKLVPGSIR